MSTPSALILDFGGVLTTDLWESVRGCARRDGLPENALLDLLHWDNEIHALFVGLERGDVDQLDFERALAGRAGIAPERLLARMCADLEPDRRMLGAVDVLRGRGVRIGVLSNSWGTGYFSPYEGYDLEDRADAIVISDQVKLRKPDPAIFTLMADKLGVPTGECVFVDDVAGNLPNAAALGMAVIHHADTASTVADLESLFEVSLA